MGDQPVPLSGTLIWYVAICRRQAWLMGHAIEPYRGHELLALGRLLQETAYQRQRKELSLPGMKVDLITPRDGDALLVGEVKRSPRMQHAQRLQLGYYLLRLREAGVAARGELRYPEQRIVEPVELTAELESAVQAAVSEVESLLTLPVPPPAVRIPACANCAYHEFCWVDEPAGGEAGSGQQRRSRRRDRRAGGSEGA
uniref:CRISPR-associated exonuclease Cas4 n=1 Tax=Thermorudis peleae TaxID=1382356 RepID=A0A831T8U4_9BACT